MRILRFLRNVWIARALWGQGAYRRHNLRALWRQTEHDWWRPNDPPNDPLLSDEEADAFIAAIEGLGVAPSSKEQE